MKKTIFLVISFFLLALAFALSLIFGAEKISFADLFLDGTNFSKLILLKIRLPRSLLVLVSGMLLAGSGAVFQLFFKNPIAEPGIMGISAGATLGAVSAQTFGFGAVSWTGFFGGASAFLNVFSISPLNLFAFLGAVFAGAVVTILAVRFTGRGSESSVMLLLCGTALGTLYSAISSIILLVKSKELYSIYTWILGSFNGRGWDEFGFILIPAIISLALMFMLSSQLDLLGYGEVTASSLGVRVHRLRVLVIVTGSLSVSAAVCAGGTISFVGLIAPHIVRKLFSPKGKILLPMSLVFGAVLLLFSDTIARTVVAPVELPAGVVTSVLGVPFFLSLVAKKGRR